MFPDVQVTSTEVENPVIRLIVYAHLFVPSCPTFISPLNVPLYAATELVFARRRFASEFIIPFVLSYVRESAMFASIRLFPSALSTLFFTFATSAFSVSL